MILRSKFVCFLSSVCFLSKAGQINIIIKLAILLEQILQKKIFLVQKWKFEHHFQIQHF